MASVVLRRSVYNVNDDVYCPPVRGSGLPSLVLLVGELHRARPQITSCACHPSLWLLMLCFVRM